MSQEGRKRFGKDHRYPRIGEHVKMNAIQNANMKNVTLKLEAGKDEVCKGYSVNKDGSVIGYVFEDSFYGWRPWSVYGHCFTLGKKPYKTRAEAVNFFFEHQE